MASPRSIAPILQTGARCKANSASTDPLMRMEELVEFETGRTCQTLGRMS